MKDKSVAFESTWRNPLPEDEIGRQQAMKENLQSGMEVSLADYGRFRYSGIWDTMHVFYPIEGQDLREIVSAAEQRYVRRDLRGNTYIELPYTRLADYVKID